MTTGGFHIDDVHFLQRFMAILRDVGLAENDDVVTLVRIAINEQIRKNLSQLLSNVEKDMHWSSFEV